MNIRDGPLTSRAAESGRRRGRGCGDEGAPAGGPSEGPGRRPRASLRVTSSTESPAWRHRDWRVNMSKARSLPELAPPTGPRVLTAAACRARSPRSPSRPHHDPRFARGWGWGSHDSHPRLAGDRGSIPIPIPDLPGIGDHDDPGHPHPHPRFAIESGIKLSTIEYRKGVDCSGRLLRPIVLVHRQST